MNDGLGRNQLSPIDTNLDLTINVYDESHRSLPSPSHRVTPEPLSFRFSASPTAQVPLIAPAPKSRQNGINRARNESRKLLSHALLQLASRRRPESIIDSITRTSDDLSATSFGALAESLKEVVHGRRSNHVAEDSDEEVGHFFTTDDTIMLMLSLQDVLSMSVAQGWHIFDDGTELSENIFEGDRESRLPSPFRRARSIGRRSRSHSPSKGQIQVPELLTSCISILKSIVSEDCRYRVAAPRPSRPPNTLQVLALNIAQFLIHHNRHNPRIISQIAFAMIPAFQTFHPQMHARLLKFFETSVIRTVLQTLEQVQGFSKNTHNTEATQPDLSDLSDDVFVSIQVEEVPNDGFSPQPQSAQRWTTPETSLDEDIQSTNNPRQSPHIYYLAFIIPPLLSAMLDRFSDLDHSDAEVSSNFVNLLRLISNSKLDAYNDILEIIAYRDPKARRLAIASISTLWPKSIGHAVVSGPFPFLENDANSSQVSPEKHAHQFVPWYFVSNSRRIRAGDVLHDDCRSCYKPIVGFSIVCPLCMTAVHFDCYDYPEGNYDLHYSMAHDLRLQRIAIFRFSYLQTNSNRNILQDILPQNCHNFCAANWFTLCLCFVCRNPLWGCFGQGVKCQDCSISVHLDCIQSLDPSNHCRVTRITSVNVTIDGNVLRQSCLDYFPELKMSLGQLNNFGFEEVSVLYDVLRTQLQLLTNGIEYGSIVILQNGKEAVDTSDHKLEEFELHATIRNCEQLLLSTTLTYASQTLQYMQDTGMTSQKPVIMFNWSYLEYVTSAVKTPLTRKKPIRTTSDLLNVGPIDVQDDEYDSTYSLEAASLAHIRNVLATQFGFRSNIAAHSIINQLHHLSFFDRFDRNPLPFHDITRDKDERCIFLLPLGLDVSINLETLVSAVEASLTDLDLSTNEFGFVLLTRRFWPSGLSSEYILKRLSARILRWILDEDANLAIILREFVAKQKPLPGVRQSRHSITWPALPDNRPAGNGLTSNGGDYVAVRRSLLHRFALPWLFELHNLDSDFYCQAVFETCVQVAADRDCEENDLVFEDNTEINRTGRCNDLLRSILKLSQYSAIFSVFDNLFLQWLEFAFESGQLDKPIPSLARFGTQENDIARSTYVVDNDIDLSSSGSALSVDPLRTIVNFASESSHGLFRSLAFLASAVKSGFNIPTASFKIFLKLLISDKQNLLCNAEMFSRAILHTVWLRTFGRQDLQSIIASLHTHAAPKIMDALQSGSDALMALSIIRLSLASCLRLYGCDRDKILTSNIVPVDEVQGLPLRKRSAPRGSGTVDPIFIEQELLHSIHLYMQSNVDYIPCLVAKFLNIFLMESPLLESFEVDNFILRNGNLISYCVWSVYNIQLEEVALVRTNLLLRSLLVDSEPLHNLIHSSMNESASPFEQRLSGINRLFRMILDVSSPAFDVEGRQWRSSVIEIFRYFFSSLWADPSEEVRLAAKSFSAALLPVHFEVISQCWNEYLTKATIAERTHLVSFLIQLRPYFSRWKVLSWEHIIDTLAQYDYDTRSGQDAHMSPTDATEREKQIFRLSSVDPDLSHLRVSIILISLQMIEDGIEIDSFSLMKLKVQFVQICGFSKISVHPTLSGQSFHLQFSDIEELFESAYPCVEELAHVVDAPHYSKLPYEAFGITNPPEDRTVNALIGSTFLDVMLCMLATLKDLSDLPVLTLKCLLETLYITLHKYNFEDPLLHHLQLLFKRAVLRTVELLSKDISYELRQLSLSIAQAAINKWHTLLGGHISTIIESVATEIASQGKNSQDSLVIHGRLLIGNTFNLLCNHGLLMSLMKRNHQAEFFNVLDQVFQVQGKDIGAIPQAICDPLLRDTLSRAIGDHGNFLQTVVQNLSSFVEVVYHSDYSVDLLKFTGQHLTQLVRRMSDGTIEGADPSPLIVIFIVLMQNHKRYINELLTYVDTVLRAALNRLQVNASCLSRLINVMSSLRPRNQELTVGGIDIINVLFEVLQDGFLMKTKMHPLTMKSLIESLLSNDDLTFLSAASIYGRVFRGMLDVSYGFLQNYIWQDDRIEEDFQALMSTGKFILQISNQDPTALQKLMEPGPEKLSRTVSMRSWNVLLLTALREGHNDWISMMFGYFPIFAPKFSALLRSYVHSGIASTVTATTDVNQSHIAMKLWLAIADTMSKLSGGGETMLAAVWEELWSAYESLLTVLETEGRIDLNRNLISLASTSVADLLIFVHSLKNALSLNTSRHVVILNRLKSISQGDASSTKITRALKLIVEPLHDPLNTAIFLDQTAKELLAAEKIRIMGLKRDNNKAANDKYKKDGRLLERIYVVYN